MVVKSGDVFVVSHGGANYGPGTVEVSLGPAECALDGSELAVEYLDPRLSCYSQAFLLFECCFLGERAFFA